MKKFMNVIKKIGVECTMNNNTSKAFSIRKREWTSSNYHIPDIVYIDANPVLDVVKKRGFGDLVEEYWGEIFKNDGMIAWSDHTEEEVLRVIHRSEFQKYAEENQINPEYDRSGKIIKQAWKVAEDIVTKEESVKITNIVYENKTKIFEVVGQFGIKIEDISSTKINKLTQSIYTTYGGSLDDAKHISYANLSGINNILTHDAGMLRYPSQNVFGASKKLIQQYNSSQSPAKYIDLSEMLLKDNLAKGS